MIVSWTTNVIGTVSINILFSIRLGLDYIYETSFWLRLMEFESSPLRIAHNS
jgi:hypothetical protein